MNWRAYLNIPEELKLSAEAKDLISRLLCNAEKRVGTNGAHEIKVCVVLIPSCIFHILRVATGIRTCNIKLISDCISSCMALINISSLIKKLRNHLVV